MFTTCPEINELDTSGTDRHLSRQAFPLGLKSGAIEDFWVNHAFRASVLEQVDQTLAGCAADVAKQFVCPGNAMRCQQDIVQLGKSWRLC